ncbi:transposable element Tcb1 transposase [Trichonephila clavipes]|nr:transposable element Tcb1 transposase [Trichonephila clavipes]
MNEALSQFTVALKRLKWAKEHIDWTNGYWSHVIWSDETKTSLFGSNGRKYARCRIGEMPYPDCIHATVKYPHTFMIWSSISVKGIGRIHITDETLNDRKCIDTILYNPNFYLFYQGSIYQQC